jgi:hypothetical protein
MRFKSYGSFSNFLYENCTKLKRSTLSLSHRKHCVCFLHSSENFNLIKSQIDYFNWTIAEYTTYPRYLKKWFNAWSVRPHLSNDNIICSRIKDRLQNKSCQRLTRNKPEVQQRMRRRSSSASVASRGRSRWWGRGWTCRSGFLSRKSTDDEHLGFQGKTYFNNLL